MLLKKTFFILSLWFSFVGIVNAQEATQSLTNLLQNLQTMQANFAQTVQDGSGTTIQQSSGRMALQRPGLFRWETVQPNQQLIVADGKSIWIYDKDLQQVTKQKQNAINNNSPGILLSDSVDNLAKRFNVKTLDNTDDNSQGFLLTPKGKKDLFQSVSLYFTNGALKQMAIHDNFGQTTQIQFSRVKTNSNVATSLFQFKAPANVDVVTG